MNGAALDSLLPVAYDELRRLARSHLRRERDGHTLSATSLVHEAWMKLAHDHDQTFENRAHFFGAASAAMRRVLVDYARGRSARKRHGLRVTLTLVDDALAMLPPVEELLAVDTAVESLAAVSPRAARVVECRYFAGLTIPETAEALGVSHTTVSEDWRFGRAWLQRALTATREAPAA